MSIEHLHTSQRPTERAVRDAAALLRGGGTVAFPTETVYGLGADATSPEAVARIYAAKGRPSFNPLIAHVASHESAMREGVFTRQAAALAEAFWPGPLTLVLQRQAKGSVCDLACAGLATLGLRVPAHSLALDFLREVARPVAAPSANRSGRVSPTDAAHVADDLGQTIDLVLDGGPCPFGIESTIIACLCDRIELLRLGSLSRSEIETTLGRRLDETEPQTITVPGMLSSHYAPKAALRLNARDLASDEIGLDFAQALGEDALDLSPSGDTREAAANLYRFLRALDARGPARIAVAPIPYRGLGEAINDRLARAAAPRLGLRSKLL